MKYENIVREVVAKNISSKLNLRQSLDTLLKNKNWKEIVRKVLSKEKGAGVTNVLLTAAVLFLSSFFGTTSAEELISKIEKEAPKIEKQVPDEVLINKLEAILPYPISAAELAMLNQDNPLLGKPLFDLKFFEKTLKQKVQETLEKNVLPGIEKDPLLKNIDSKRMEDLIFKAFKKKLEKPAHSKALKDLKTYLKKQDTNFALVDDIVMDSIRAIL